MRPNSSLGKLGGVGKLLLCAAFLLPVLVYLLLDESSEQMNKRMHGWRGQIPHLFTVEELARCRGEKDGDYLLLSIEGVVFDVAIAKQTYGPGGHYSFFAGRDATRSFADGCFSEKCFRPQLFTEDTDEDEREAIARWYDSYRTALDTDWKEYRFVGYLDSVFQHYHPTASLSSPTPPLSAHSDSPFDT